MPVTEVSIPRQPTLARFSTAQTSDRQECSQGRHRPGSATCLMANCDMDYRFDLGLELILTGLVAGLSACLRFEHFANAE
jgi:hypothetical protein